MNREGKKCVLYPRVSTEMQVDGYSLEGQKNSLKRFADREEMEIVGIYEDAGKSGKSIEGRPAFKKMLSDIKNGLEIDYILVYKLSRFGRNAADILNSLEFVQSYGINLICIEEGIDSSQTSGKLLISVLSAVAEIERENIIEQTMNGRREKARQGGWNGGFAPYGYYLKDNQLLIEETEAEAIRIIFDKFANSDVGLGGVAKYLNLQGIKKIPRQNGTLETWSSHFIRLILDNPVYCGKIAYGRRTREKVKGTKNEYKQVHTDDYILEDGQHEGIVSEELWQKAHTKRMATGIKQPSKIGKDRSHLLTGILKCPICGSSMYTNKHAWTNKDGTYKEVYYYICGRNKQERGHHCDYKASLRKTDIEPLVIEAVKELVSDKYFAKEIEKRIGVQTDTTAIDKELANYESKLKEVDLNKARLEREIDNLPIDARFRERKIHDMTLRLDGLYDTIVELEERIEDAKLRRSSIEMEAITLDNIYKLMLNFGKLYDIISDEEKKNLITYLIKEIQIYPNGESEMPLKSIEFNFPIYRDGQEVRRLLWEKGNTVDIMSLYTNDTDTLRQMIAQSMAQLVSSVFTLAAVFFCMLYISIWLTLIVCAVMALILVFVRKLTGRIGGYFMAQQTALADLNGYVEEMVNGQKVVKVFCHEGQSKAELRRRNRVWAENAARASGMANSMMPMMNAVGYLQYVIIAVIGGTMAIAGTPNLGLTGMNTLTLGMIASFLTLSRGFTNPISQISNQFNSIVTALAGASRIFAFMDAEPETDDGYVTLVNAKEENGTLAETDHHTGLWAWKHPHGDGTVTYTKLAGRVVFDHVDFGYTPDKEVLHDITLYAEPGQKVAFVGATGAGKTTITNLINRFYDIADGKIRYDGININKIRKADLRRSLGIVLQDVNLFTGTVMENIRYGNPDATDDECIAAAKLANADHFIRMLPDGYNTVLKGDGSGLSQGQRQLLSIARAAVSDPPVMILDEATSSIDTRTEALVQSGMDKLMEGRTVFVIAHRLSTVKNADVIMVLDHGRIIERGNHAKLIAEKGVYYQLYTGAFELE